MRSPEPRTIAEAIDVCRQRLRKSSQTPWLDARLLTQYVTGLDGSAVIAYGDCKLDRTKRAKLLELAERRAAGEPVAYIIGRKQFCGLEFLVDKRVLVPRPETELLVMACVNDWSNRPPGHKPVLRIADVGTGCGAIACALAHLLPSAQLTACDVSTDAISLAKTNAASLGLQEQITFVVSDLLAAIDKDVCFDVIIANLPYVSEASVAQLEPWVRQHEPELALMGGSDGLDLYRKLFNQAPDYLRNGGAIYCECGPDNADGLAAIAKKTFPSALVQKAQDLAGLDRMIICSLPAEAQ